MPRMTPGDEAKLRDAEREVLGFGREPEERELPAPSQPMHVARRLASDLYTTTDGHLSLRHWRGGWWRWQTTAWTEVEDAAIREDAYRFTEHAYYLRKDSDGNLVAVPWDPNRHKIGDLLDALTAVCFLPETVQQPTWIGRGKHPAGVIVSCANGLLHVDTRQLLDHSPRFFNTTAVPFDYEPDALEPGRWLKFLEDLWGDDQDSIDALQEWFGYTISGRTNMHKIMLLVGPTRAGKGVIARILGAQVGTANVAGPTLSSLGGEFGLAPLLGKSLAVISDARLNGRSTSTVVERLLAVSGEDWITVNRKYREQWTGKLPCRFVVISNELPHLGDAAGAIVGRFVVLLLTKSWIGQEDHDLEAGLREELPEILKWSLDGLDRLRAQDRFTRPASTDDAMVTLSDLASPVSAFVRDRCWRGAGAEALCSAVYAAWKQWAEDNGNKPGTAQSFGRDLRAVVPGLRVVRPRDGDHRDRVYRGVGLR